VPGIIAFAGGLPIMSAGGAHVGAIGVSGGTADQDEQCAQAGLDAAKDALK
jgi:glc operon protein GlcG